MLFLATSIIPCLVFVAILFLIFQSVSSIVWKYFVPPPKSVIDFSISHSPTYPFLIGYFFISVVSLAFTTISILFQKYFWSIFFLFIPLFFITFKTIYVYQWYQESFYESLLKSFFDAIDMLDLIFFFFVSILLFWQISILWRIRAKNSQMKIGLK